jgi:hypothetical protein
MRFLTCYLNHILRLGESQTICFTGSSMPNHSHLLLRTGLTPISTVMRRLLTDYAISVNLRHRE